ncbi:MAG: hypothetical protein IKK91_01245 [Ruminococcus sp.]|nr:hypothetical protein [Ruminococcus sp.]
MNDLHEIAGKILAVKTIYGEMYEDYLHCATKEGEWIHHLLMKSLDDVYNELVSFIQHSSSSNK